MASYQQLGISEQLMNLIYEAIGRGLAARPDSDSLIPTLIVQPLDSPGHLVVLATETADQAIATGRWAVASGNAAHYVLSYDGYVTDPGLGIPRSEAIHVEAYESSAGHGVHFAQRYQSLDAGQTFSQVGNPIYLQKLPMPTVAEYEPIVQEYERKRGRSHDTPVGE